MGVPANLFNPPKEKLNVYQKKDGRKYKAETPADEEDTYLTDAPAEMYLVLDENPTYDGEISARIARRTFSWKQAYDKMFGFGGGPGVGPDSPPPPPARFRGLAAQVLGISLSNPGIFSITDVGGIPNVTSNTPNGTVRYVVVPTGNTPTTPQVQAGQRADGTPALAAFAQPITLGGVQIFPAITTLPGATNADIIFQATSGAGGESAQVRVNFTTLAATIPLLTSGPTWSWDGSFIHIFFNTNILATGAARHGVNGGPAGTYGAWYAEAAPTLTHEILLGVAEGVNPGDIDQYTIGAVTPALGTMAPAGNFVFTAGVASQHDTTIRANSVLTPNPPSDGSPNWFVAPGTGSGDAWGIDTNSIINVGHTDGSQLLRNFGSPNQKVTFTVGPNYNRLFNDCGVILRSDGAGAAGTFFLMFIGSSNNIILLDVIAGVGGAAYYNGAANTNLLAGDVWEVGINGAGLITVKQNGATVAAASGFSTAIAAGNNYGMRNSGDPTTWSFKDISCVNNP